MKKNYFYIILLTIIAGTALFLLTHYDDTKSHTDKTKPHFKVAVFSPAIHPSLEKIEQAYKHTLAQSKDAYYKVISYNGTGDGQRIGLLANTIVSKDFDAIFTIGAGLTILTKNLLQKHESLTPQIFTAVTEPIKAGIKQQNAYITGVIEENDFERHISLIKNLIPKIKNILLIYCPTGGSNLDGDRQIIEKSARKHALSLKSIEVFSSAEISAKTAAAIQRTDAVLILKDNVVVSGLEGLLKICNTFEKPLLASDLDSVERGAFSAVGLYEEQFGIQGARLTRQILENQINPQDIPFAHAGDLVCKLNKKQIVHYQIDVQKIETLRTLMPVEII